LARLTRDYRAMRRAFQISNVQLHVLVEGRNTDDYVYEQICKISAEGRSYRITRGDQLTAAHAGGKKVLLGFFDFLRAQEALLQLGHHTTLFCLDKDIDDVERKVRRSDHVFYTETYDIEGAIFPTVDLRRCAAAAASTQEHVVSWLGPPGTWCHVAAGRWREWVALCLLSRAVGSNHANYGSTSRVNDSSHDPADPAKVLELLHEMSTASGLSVAQIEARYERRLRKVRALELTGNVDRVFKGKWYSRILAHELKATVSDISMSEPALEASLKASALLLADWRAGWAAPARARISRLASGV
jgi:hypothetical protein